jgi:chromate transporter
MHTQPSLVHTFTVWLSLGLQSFGGGAATLYLIRQAAVERHGWLSAEQFTRDWAICQIAPGINLLGLTILIGRRIGGPAGAFVALLGLLLPSVTITIGLTALYAIARNLGPAEAALQGIIPATAGLGLLLAVQTSRPLLQQAEAEGRVAQGLAWLILLGSALLYVLFRPPVIIMLIGGGVVGAVGAALLRRPTTDDRRLTTD